MTLETIVGIAGIIMTAISIIVTGIGILQTTRENKRHQKSNRSDQS